MPNYRRNFVLGGSYFFTVNLLERQRSLLTDHIDLLRDSVRRVRRLYPFDIDAWNNRGQTTFNPAHNDCYVKF